MKKHIPLIIAWMIFVCMPDISFGFDKDGCLTCHQYPGLVRQETPVKFKMLHIDEDKYAASSHGKVGCKECHADITEIPHNPRLKINCVKECHQKDKVKILAMKADPAKFHAGQHFLISNLQNDSSCAACHSLYPHTGNKKVSAFLNMHTGYVVCEVCHLDKSKIKQAAYEWKSPEDVTFKGRPYASFYNQKTGKVERHDAMISRITVYTVAGGEKRPALNVMDNNEAIGFLEKWSSMGKEEKDKRLKIFHKDIAKKEVSIVCNECHSEKGILDFKKLGFSATRTNDLKYLNIKSLVTKYDTFVLPNLFGK